MSREVEDVVLRAVGDERSSLVLVGPDAAVASALAEVTAPLRELMTMVLPERAEDAAWAAGMRALPWAEHGLEPLVRACLRQDPDALVVQAPGHALPWGMLVQAVLTGRQLLVHVRGAHDEAALEGLRAAARDLGLAPGAALPWLVVLDDLGVGRIVATDGALGDAPSTVWRRGAPLPASLAALRPPAPASSSWSAAEEAIEPLDPALVERVRARVAPHVRPSFRPVTTPAAGDAARSKLGGLPMLGPGEAWPTCACGLPMPLALQLDRDEVPPEARACFPEGARWLQLFYCSSTGCTVEDAWTAAAPNKRLRFLAAEGAVPAASIPAGFEDADWEPHDVTGWERLDETPATDDLEPLDDAARDDRWALSTRRSWRKRAASDGRPVPDEPASDEELALLAGPRAGDKLLGWPAWAQAPEWQRCPRCGARMEPLFQLDADAGRLTMLFAADGTGHVTQCPTHRDELAFAWACG